MRKSTVLAAGMAIGAMIGATTATEPTQTTETRQVTGQAEKPAPPAEQQKQTRQEATEVRRYQWPDRVYQKEGKRNPTRKSRNWSPTRSMAFNKIKHGRNTRRKHRRA